MAGSKIGELNGKWALLLKLHLIAIPPVIGSIVALMVWLVSQQFADIAFRTSGERFSKSDAFIMQDQIRDRERVMQSALMVRIDMVDRRINDVEKQLERVLVILEQRQGEVR